MCAPHKATLLPDCTPKEAALLLTVAGYNVNPEFFDPYLTATEPQNETARFLKAGAQHRDFLLRVLLQECEDTPEGGSKALNRLREFVSRGTVAPEVVAIGTPVVPGSCCHRSS